MKEVRCQEKECADRYLDSPYVVWYVDVFVTRLT
jgi:hypothetical protein